MGLKARHALPVPVISVGNLTAGGTGKTPFTVWLARALLAAGRRPGVLSRGYGARAEGSLLSDEGAVRAALLGPGVPQVEAPDRVRGGASLLAAHHEIDVLLLDDGFQHVRLRRDLDVVLLDATDPFGGGHLLPLGMLREKPSALARAGAVVINRAERVTAKTLEGLRARVRALAPDAVLAVARLGPRALLAPDGRERPSPTCATRRSTPGPASATPRRSPGRCATWARRWWAPRSYATTTVRATPSSPPSPRSPRPRAPSASCARGRTG